VQLHSVLVGPFIQCSPGEFRAVVCHDPFRIFGYSRASEEPIHDPIEGKLERFRSRYCEFAGAAQEALAALQRDEGLHFGATELVQLESTCSGRVVVIGEAAHPHPPRMAEGACLAMEDAVVLGEELSRVSDVPTALRAFHARRRPRVREVVRIALDASRRMAASISLYASPIGRGASQPQRV
jgi:2-polyprenyl-6-methoxyphenol hydroxylase-like FAD-dependent oxidoreductase